MNMQGGVLLAGSTPQRPSPVDRVVIYGEVEHPTWDARFNVEWNGCDPTTARRCLLSALTLLTAKARDHFGPQFVVELNDAVEQTKERVEHQTEEQ